MEAEVSSAKYYYDFKGFQSLRNQAQKNDGQAIETVAKQFESLFLNMMMSSMRKANEAFGKDNFLNSGTTDFYQEMYDKQLSTDMSNSSGLGLAKILAQQLRQKTGATSAADAPESPAQLVMNKVSQMIDKTFSSPEDFVEKLLPTAKLAAKELGVEPTILLAQAALETGWGKHIIKSQTGESSFNLFNIKANQSWDKNAIATPTLEYEDGIAVKKTESFRQYDNYHQSFSDYANLIKNSGRYQSALSAQSPKRYIEQLQKNGYATDPNYATKVYEIYKSPLIQNAVMREEVK